MLQFVGSQRVRHDLTSGQQLLHSSSLKADTFPISSWASQVVLVEKSTCQCKRQKRCGFDPLVGKIPCSREWQPTPVFLPGKIHPLSFCAIYRENFSQIIYKGSSFLINVKKRMIVIFSWLTKTTENVVSWTENSSF